MISPSEWEQYTQETVTNLSNLIQIDTTNPPGNELPAIQYIQRVLIEAGVPQTAIHILESAPTRANLIARIKGDGSQRPLLFSGHVDVVPAERNHWSRDPFGGEIADGCVWGRGAMDMKGFLCMYLQIFLLVHRLKLPLKRDLILAAIADEEAGFDHGSKFLVDHHKELIDAEYGLNEAGAITLYAGKSRLYPIQVAEKGVCWLRATAKGRPGHGSIPHGDNAVFHLSQAIERIGQSGGLPIHLTPTVRAMLQELTNQSPFPLNIAFFALKNPAIAKFLLRFLPEDIGLTINAMFRNTVSPTILKAGDKTNVIPSEAEAQLDCRTLPGQTPESAMKEIMAITGDSIDLEPIITTEGAEFSTQTPLYKTLMQATKEMDPQGLVFPMLMPGATDAAEYKRAGITVYGFTPGVYPEEIALTRMAHGHDERIPISAIRSGLPALWYVIENFSLSDAK